MKHRFKFKKLAFAALILVFWLFVLFSVQCLIVPKYQTGIVEGSMIEEYYDEELDHEVIMVGDCEVYENISTIELWKEYGITSYIRGSAQQLTWHSYYLLEDTLRYETPKVVVFNVLALKYNEPQSEAYNRMTLDGMRWSSSKVNAIKASMIKDSVDKETGKVKEGENFIDYVFPMFRYHSRWSELSADDFKHIYTKNKVTHNGYYMRVDSKAQEDFPPPELLYDYKFGDNAMKYLQMMTDLCKEKGIELVLIKAPTEEPYWYDQWDSQMVKFAEENELSYINFIPLQDEIGLDMSVDTYDKGLHLNLSGAEKFADYFGKWLVENHDLTDYRENPEYSEVWQEKVEDYEKAKEAQFKEIAEYGKIVSLGPIETKENSIVKNLIVLAVLAALCLTLVACNTSSTTEESVNSTSSEAAQTSETVSKNEPAGTPVAKNNGYVMAVNGVNVAIDAPMASLLEGLGEPTKYYESESCAFQGLDKVYTYGSVIIRTYPIDGVDYVLNIELKDDTVTTVEGLAIGDAKSKVTSLYGEPTDSNDSAVRYVKNGSVLTVFLTDGVVSAISYSSEDSI